MTEPPTPTSYRQQNLDDLDTLQTRLMTQLDLLAPNNWNTDNLAVVDVLTRLLADITDAVHRVQNQRAAILRPITWPEPRTNQPRAKSTPDPTPNEDTPH